MPVLRKNKTSHYTVIDNNVFMNKELSLKAKGLLCQMLSLPDNWEYSVNGLAMLSNDGVTAVRSALNELEEHGYFRRERVYENGRLAGVEYIISETPMGENLMSENLILEEVISEEHPQLNTKDNKVKKESIPKDIYSEIVDYLNDRIGSSYKWKAVYIQTLINARLREGATVDDFKRVIDIKASEWLCTDMAKYLRPQTLFGTKFEAYLNQKPSSRSDQEFDVIEEWGRMHES